ncbi:MAG: signal peptidase II [Microthrixaceae bacterium]
MTDPTEADESVEPRVPTAPPSPGGTSVLSRFGGLIAAAGLVIVVDQLTKTWATGLRRCVELNERPLVGFCLAHNQGMAFSVGWGRGVVISLVALAIVVTLVLFSRRMTPVGRVVVGVVVGGALGNLVDRAFRASVTPGPRGFMGGAVVDFLYSRFWATFNVADSCVVVGGIALAVLMWRMPDDIGDGTS